MPPHRGRAANTGHQYEPANIDGRSGSANRRPRNRRSGSSRRATGRNASDTLLTHNIELIEIQDSPPTTVQDSRPPSPRESICFTTKLSSSDVTNTYLLLDKAEAATLTPDPEKVMRYDEDGMYLEDVGDPFKVFDEMNKEYAMQIRVSCAHATSLFWLEGDWVQFVKTNEAKRNERVTFYRCKEDDDDNGSYYHVIRFPDRMMRMAIDKGREKYAKRGVNEAERRFFRR